jgi:flagellar biosynthesis/type III secretory pathway protein FliH
VAMTTFEKGVQEGLRQTARIFERGVQEGLRQAAMTFEKGVQTGLQEGQRQGWRAALRKQLHARFGLLSPRAYERLDGLSLEELDALTLALLKAQSLQELGLED